MDSEQNAYGWSVVSASVRGTGHTRAGLPCQDANYWTYLTRDILAAAVADGAGSASLAEIGANLACRRVLEAVAQLIQPLPKTDEEWRNVVVSALQFARNQVEEEARNRGVEARELATTLIVMIMMPDLVVVAQIGDGAAVVADALGQVQALTVPTRGEYANETVFLTSIKDPVCVQAVVWRGQAAHLAMFSDGLQMLALKMPEGTPHTPFFTPLFRFVSESGAQEDAHLQLESFLRSPRITERVDDDLTLLLAVRTN